MKFNFFIGIFLFIECFQPYEPIFGRDYSQHKIKKGDNLTKISDQYDVSIRKILEKNHLKSKNKIFVGQILKIPSKQKRPTQKKFLNTPRFVSPVRNKKLIKRFDFKAQHRTTGILWGVTGDYNVYPTSPGRVIKIGYLRGYGKYIMVDHGLGWISFYSNLTKILVRKNERVLRSQRIGTLKNKKLFFSISYDGKPLNPIPLIKMNAKKLKIS